MIDLTNKPDGATHYIKDVFYRLHKGVWLFYAANCGWTYCHESKGWSDSNCIEIPSSWTIYNNDKPLSELPDEQRGLLLNYRCDGGDIETESSIGWRVINCPQWIFTSTYRAKQKSERELFISASMKFCVGGKKAEETFGEMFDNGARFTNEQNS